MKYVITIIICSLLLCVSFAAEQQDNTLMPEGFEKIHLGMDWSSLISLRPNVEIFNLMPDPHDKLKPNPKKPKSGLIEQLTSGPFEHATYFFEDGVLVAAMFGREETDPSTVERQKLLGRVAEKRGMPSSIEIMEEEKGLGILTWIDQSAQVNVIAPVSKGKTKRGVLVFQVMDRQYAEHIKALGSSVKRTTKMDRAKGDEVKVNALEAEVRGLLSNMNIDEKK